MTAELAQEQHGQDRATLANWREAPHNAWAFHHVREIIPTAEIRNHGPVSALPEALRDLSAVRTAAGDLAATLAGLDNDALVVLKDGALVHESYRNGMGRHDPHILMSVSKSMLGLVAGALVHRGALDPDAPLIRHAPELAGTAYQDATVRNALDMRVGVKFDEDYTATSGPMIDYRRATGWNTREPGAPETDLCGFYPSLTERDGSHGGRFHYTSPSTDLLGWVMERATGARYADLVAQHLWTPIGAETAGYVTVDRLGAARAAGGMCVTARDLARVGRMVADGGAGDITGAWLDDILHNGDAQAWAAGSFADMFPGLTMRYRSKWYQQDRDGGVATFGLGVHGQYLWVSPATGVVIAAFSSQAAPLDEMRHPLYMALFDGIEGVLA